MNKEELDSIEELIERKILLAEVSGGLTSSDRKFIDLWNYTIELQNNWNSLKEWLKEEKNRLARKVSHIYEDSLGKTRLVNKDIYNELNNVIDKMQDIESRK